MCKGASPLPFLPPPLLPVPSPFGPGGSGGGHGCATAATCGAGGFGPGGGGGMPRVEAAADAATCASELSRLSPPRGDHALRDPGVALRGSREVRSGCWGGETCVVIPSAIKV